MIYSMTGYGRAQTTIGGYQITVDVRSLNSKQLDMNIRLPQSLKFIEAKVRATASKVILRGKVDFYFNIEANASENVSPLNENLLKLYSQQLMRINHDLGLPQTGVLNAVLQLPEIAADPSFNADEATKPLLDLCCLAVNQLMDYRKNDGDALANVFKINIALIDELREKVAVLAPERNKKVRENLVTKLEELGPDYDKNRLEQELIYYIEKIDINEELVRLEKNCQMFKEEMAVQTERKGKKLGFISQEIGREINTIGSKANDAALQALVVKMKDALEQIKEQVLNVL